MVDFLLGVACAALAVKGWIRSIRSETYELAAVVLGTAVSFRIAAPIGDAISTRFGTTPEAARVSTGFVMLLLVTAGLVTLERSLVEGKKPARGLRSRLAGLAVSVTTGLVVVAVVVSVIRAIPGESAIQSAFEGSSLVDLIVPRQGVGEAAVATLAGDPVLRALLAIQPALGTSRVVLGSVPVSFEPQEPDHLELRHDLAGQVGDLVSESRVGIGVTPPAWSEGLAGVAAAYALEMYTGGRLSHDSPDSGTLDQRVASAAITLLEVDEVVTMAASVAAVHQATLDEEAARQVMTDARYDRFGVGVVDGPLGLLVVEVFGR
jgi:uncharacterized protein YkwD